MGLGEPPSHGLDFAATLRENPAGQPPLALVNARTDKVLVDTVELAVTRQTRNKGLLGRTGLSPSAALVLAPCFSIHTAFMRFPIDCAFVTRAGRVVKLVHDLRPWRVALAPRAYAVVELAAGALRRSGVAVGDRLYFARRAGGGPAGAEARQ